MIDDLYENLTHTIQRSSQKHTRRYIRKSKFYVIPRWNRCVKGKHIIAREKYLTWVRHGRLRGASPNEMLMSTMEFKKALNERIKNEHNEICLSTVDKFYQRDKTQFWKDV